MASLRCLPLLPEASLEGRTLSARSCPQGLERIGSYISLLLNTPLLLLHPECRCEEWVGGEGQCAGKEKKARVTVIFYRDLEKGDLPGGIR